MEGPLFLELQVICKYCNIKKEIVTESSTDSPLTTFSLLLSPNQRTETGEVTSPRKDSRRPTEKWIVPENLPIDLRVKVAVCLIHLRQLPLDKVRARAHECRKCVPCSTTDNVVCS